METRIQCESRAHAERIFNDAVEQGKEASYAIDGCKPGERWPGKQPIVVVTDDPDA